MPDVWTHFANMLQNLIEKYADCLIDNESEQSGSAQSSDELDEDNSLVKKPAA